jgi:hypothetical protein
MISGFETPKWKSFEEIEDLLAAASKYEMPGPCPHCIYVAIFQRAPVEALCGRCKLRVGARGKTRIDPVSQSFYSR